MSPDSNSNIPEKKLKPKDPWKYVEPRDLTQPIEINDKKWYFCTKCKCRATGRTGIYQLSHTDAMYDQNWRPQGNSTPVQDPDPTPSPSLQPPTSTSEPLDDDLVFTGVHYAPVVLDEREAASIARSLRVAGMKHFIHL